MKVSSLLKESVCEISFGNNSKMELYTISMSDIPELSAMLKIGGK